MSDQHGPIADDDLTATGLFDGPEESAETSSSESLGERALFPTADAVPEPPAGATTRAGGLFDSAPDRDSSADAAPPGETAGVGGPIPEQADRKPRHGMTPGRIVLISVAAVVVLSVVGTATALGMGAQRAAEAAEAMAQLGRDETALIEQIAQLNQSIETLETDVTAAAADAQAYAQLLASMAGVSDETVRATTESARVAYAEALAQITVPEKHSAYRRDEIDTESVQNIEDAQAEAADLESGVSESSSEVRQAFTELTEAGEGFTLAMTTFRETFPAYAETLITENLDADEAFHASVRDSAAAVATASGTAATRAAVWNQYIADVAALRADQLRVTEEREQSQQNNWYPGNGDERAQPDPQEPDPVAPDPVNPSPQPDPVDPVPGTPDPEPTP